MEITLNKNYTILNEELELINGGTWKQAGYAFVGTLSVAFSLPVGVVNPPAGVVLFGTGLYALGSI